jgi:hypothetical protein
LDIRFHPTHDFPYYRNATRERLTKKEEKMKHEEPDSLKSWKGINGL